jgi:predicted site-specific integrase-resolvase
MSGKVAIYARVSTTNHGQDVKVQTRDLEQFSQARGWQLIDSYLDTGISGSKDSRPELNRLMADAHKRRFDVVVVWRFDRFARSVSHLLRALETFNALGIAFVSLSEQMDTTTPMAGDDACLDRPFRRVDPCDARSSEPKRNQPGKACLPPSIRLRSSKLSSSAL